MPMTVIAGYLGAGKTTLINKILAENHGLRLMVMVNDFGAINIDEKLLVSSDEDTLTLTNGCVCCTIGSDLFLAIGDVLDRRPRPDHLIVEASGIADPARIANVAIAEPELSYGGIVTVVDAQNFEELCDDPLIGSQICGQIAQSDLIVATKTKSSNKDLPGRLYNISKAPIITSDAICDFGTLLLDNPECPAHTVSHPPHPVYASWSFEGTVAMKHEEIVACLEKRPAGIFRLKGMVQDPQNDAWEVHVVGSRISVSKTTSAATTQLVAIGLVDDINHEKIDRWWNLATCEKRRDSCK